MTTQLSTSDLIAAIEDLGYKITNPRRDLINLLGEKNQGFTAEEISKELIHVGRATVYRTLQLLLDAGLICKLAMPDITPRYALSRLGHHHHTVCNKCGAIKEFRDSTIERLLKAAEPDIEGSLVGHRIDFYIICETCIEH